MFVVVVFVAAYSCPAFVCLLVFFLVVAMLLFRVCVISLEINAMAAKIKVRDSFSWRQFYRQHNEIVSTRDGRQSSRDVPITGTPPCELAEESI